MNQDYIPMDPRRIQLAFLWAALMLIYLLGDVLRIYEKGNEASLIDGQRMTQGHLLFAALFMLIPILLALGTVFLPQGIMRWAGMISAAILLIFNALSLSSYSGLFDRVLLAVSLAMNALTIYLSWRW